MTTKGRVYPPEPEKVLNFVKLQVTDALLDTDLFPEDAPENASSVLCALAVLSAVPPVPNNRAILDATFIHMQKVFDASLASPFEYEEIVRNYNRFLGVFQKASSLPAKTPLSNPYEQVAKAAAYQLGFPEDGARIFHLTVWLAYYCKDALALFYTQQTVRHNTKNPVPADIYLFISRHVNNSISDTGFFLGTPPANSTEVLTALYLFVAIQLPTHNASLVQDTLQYTNSLLKEHGFPPEFFDTIVYSYERVMATYEANLAGESRAANNFTFEQMTDEAVKIMGLFPNRMLSLNIIGYYPTLLDDAMKHLYKE